MTAWTYRGQPFTSDQIGQYVGMVYLIHDTATGMRYVGQKKFHSVKTLPPLKGKTRKRKIKTESEWQTYVGSNEDLKAIAATHGQDRLTKTILHLCYTKSEMNFIELHEQMTRNVLFDPMYHNGIINIRCNAKHIANSNVIPHVLMSKLSIS